jgi:peptide chain release factor subunit 1
LERRGVGNAVTTEMEQAVLDLRPPTGRSGRALIAGTAGVVLSEHLVRPTAATQIRVSELPYIVPIVEHGFTALKYVLVEVDHAGADITIHVDGIFGTEIVDGGGWPVHKASSADTTGYGDPQPRAQEAVARTSARWPSA